jgi:hypothetical protein
MPQVSGAAEAAAIQDQVLSRGQLRQLGVTVSQENAQLVAGRWQAHPPNAVVLHNGPLTRRQDLWVAVVNAGVNAALCAFTALELDGLTGWPRPAIEVLVERGTQVRAKVGVRVHESRRFSPSRDIHPTRTPPRTRTARSAIDAAVWSRSSRTAVGVLAAVVQQRLVQPADLAAELDRAGQVRHRNLLRRAVVDIAGGAQALSEIDFARLCRRYGLPEPARQSVRVDRNGKRRYLDAEWVAGDGTRVAAEVDGAIHLLPRTYWDDQERANELVLEGQTLLRFPAYVVRANPKRVADQLTRALRRHLSG